MLCKGKQDKLYSQQLKHICKFLLSQYLIVPQKILKKKLKYTFGNHSGTILFWINLALYCIE